MNGIISHIEFLLTQHDCVIIPGFGGFVLRNQAAVFVSKHELMPPCKMVAFNAALTHNDGLLANSLIREKQISYNEAMILIESEVRSMQMHLQQGLTVELNSLGAIRQGQEGELIFTPSQRNHFDLSLFGFSPLALQPLFAEIKQQEEKVETEPEGDVVFVPVNMRLLRRVSAVAALVIGLLFVSHPVEYGDIPQHHASMISSNLLTKAIVPHFAYYEDQLIDETEQGSEILAENIPTELPENDVFAEAVTEAVDASVELSAVETVTPTPEIVEPVKRYYIIIGSFPNREQAEKRISYLSRKGVNGVQYLLKDNKYRLYINTFADKGDANNYLDGLRASDSRFSDAWLLAHISR